MRDLTKWPRLVVVPDKPEPLSREQANEILIRTCSPYFFSNDHGWERQVRDILGHPHRDSIEGPSAGNVRAWIDAEREWADSLGILDLQYCHNSQIISAWIGGPHGWCDWDGNLGCSTWNIGKWPAHDNVTEDWEKIAAAFPYLDLYVQCITDEGEGDVAGQWRVTGGKAALVEPVERMEVHELGDAQVLGRMFMPGGERGVTAERLREAVEQIRGGRAV